MSNSAMERLQVEHAAYIQLKSLQGHVIPRSLGLFRVADGDLVLFVEYCGLPLKENDMSSEKVK